MIIFRILNFVAFQIIANNINNKNTKIKSTFPDSEVEIVIKRKSFLVKGALLQ